MVTAFDPDDYAWIPGSEILKSTSVKDLLKECNKMYRIARREDNSEYTYYLPYNQKTIGDRKFTALEYAYVPLPDEIESCFLVTHQDHIDMSDSFKEKAWGALVEFVDLIMKIYWLKDSIKREESREERALYALLNSHNNIESFLRQNENITQLISYLRKISFSEIAFENRINGLLLEYSDHISKKMPHHFLMPNILKIGKPFFKYFDYDHSSGAKKPHSWPAVLVALYPFKGKVLDKDDVTIIKIRSFIFCDIAIDYYEEIKPYIKINFNSYEKDYPLPGQLKNKLAAFSDVKFYLNDSKIENEISTVIQNCHNSFLNLKVHKVIDLMDDICKHDHFIKNYNLLPHYNFEHFIFDKQTFIARHYSFDKAKGLLEFKKAIENMHFTTLQKMPINIYYEPREEFLKTVIQHECGYEITFGEAKKFLDIGIGKGRWKETAFKGKNDYPKLIIDRVKKVYAFKFENNANQHFDREKLILTVKYLFQIFYVIKCSKGYIARQLTHDEMAEIINSQWAEEIKNNKLSVYSAIKDLSRQGQIEEAESNIILFYIAEN